MKLSSNHLYCIGIGGIGVSAIAKYFLAEGARVSGSDLVQSIITDEIVLHGAHSAIGPQRAENIPPDVDLCVFSPALREDNPELVEMKRRGIRVLSYPEMLGVLMEDRVGITVSGTHGKSTTTSILGLLLAEGGLDPTVIVGSRVSLFDGNLRRGKGDLLVAEACEWRAHMMHMRPQHAILTNLEADHLDYYRDLEHIIKTFEQFFARLPETGICILPHETDYTERIREVTSARVHTFGVDEKADISARSIRVKNERHYFEIMHGGNALGEFSLSLPGKFNILNALAACALAFQLGISPDAAKKVVESFPGIWRRFERVGEYRGAIVVSDYAHHPT
ncbi:MAG: UDP-N-acetylmuramate--L-alanine ligase, partial [Parcubacteria group bacterium]|nr:UDP-N-acetylmuramate--L-alanine ligase [Parcubacteria group bacterium]